MCSALSVVLPRAWNRQVPESTSEIFCCLLLALPGTSVNSLAKEGGCLAFFSEFVAKQHWAKLVSFPFLLEKRVHVPLFVVWICLLHVSGYNLSEGYALILGLRCASPLLPAIHVLAERSRRDPEVSARD